MKPSILIIFGMALLGLFLSDCGQNKSTPPEEEFLGEWYTIKGDVETYSFLKDDNSYIFVGTVGMRPVIYGTWKIDNEKLIITMDNGLTTEYFFTVSNDTLTLNEGAEIYTRTEPLEVKYPEVHILVNISSEFSSLKFSKPQLVDLNWGYWIDSTRSTREFSLKAYSITAGSTLLSDDVKQLSEYIKDYGFEADTVFVSDICDGYWDNNQIITLCTNQADDAINDSIYICINSALIVK